MLYEIQGTYGSYNTPCTVFVYEVKGVYWYCCEGSVNINATWEHIPNNVNVEMISDVDCITVSEPINSLEELEMAVDL